MSKDTSAVVGGVDAEVMGGSPLGCCGSIIIMFLLKRGGEEREKEVGDIWVHRDGSSGAGGEYREHVFPLDKA